MNKTQHGIKLSNETSEALEEYLAKNPEIKKGAFIETAIRREIERRKNK